MAAAAALARMASVGGERRISELTARAVQLTEDAGSAAAACVPASAHSVDVMHAGGIDVPIDCTFTDAELLAVGSRPDTDAIPAAASSVAAGVVNIGANSGVITSSDNAGEMEDSDDVLRLIASGVYMSPLEVTLPLAAAQRALNLRPEVTETLLCYAAAAGALSLGHGRFTTIEVTVLRGITAVALALEVPIIATLVRCVRRVGSAPANAAGPEASLLNRMPVVPPGLLTAPESIVRRDDRGRVVIRVSLDEFLASVQEELPDAASRAVARQRAATAAAASQHRDAAHVAAVATAAAIRASALQRGASAFGLMRELYALQAEGRITVAFSEWGLALSCFDATLSPSVERKVSMQTAASTSPQFGTALPAAAVALLRGDSGSASAAVESLAVHLESRMASCRVLSLNRLVAVHTALRAAALPSWTHVWADDQPIAGSPGPSLRPAEAESSLLAIVDAYLSRNSIDAPALPQLVIADDGPRAPSAKASLLGASAPPSRLAPQVPDKLLAQLVTDIHATLRRMSEVLSAGSSSRRGDDDEADKLQWLRPTSEGGRISSSSAALVTPVAVARILHGVYTPVFPAADFRPLPRRGGGRYSGGGGWGGGLWGRYAEFAFDDVVNVASRVLRHATTVLIS